jgi:hypothetical protein
MASERLASERLTRRVPDLGANELMDMGVLQK